MFRVIYFPLSIVHVDSSTLISLNVSPSIIGGWPFRPTFKCWRNVHVHNHNSKWFHRQHYTVKGGVFSMSSLYRWYLTRWKQILQKFIDSGIKCVIHMYFKLLHWKHISYIGEKHACVCNIPFSRFPPQHLLI